MATDNIFGDGGYRNINAGRPLTDVISELNDRIVTLEAHLGWDEELRKQNPALQDLYEKFQLTKKLTI